MATEEAPADLEVAVPAADVSADPAAPVAIEQSPANQAAAVKGSSKSLGFRERLQGFLRNGLQRLSGRFDPSVPVAIEQRSDVQVVAAPVSIAPETPVGIDQSTGILHTASPAANGTVKQETQASSPVVSAVEAELVQQSAKPVSATTDSEIEVQPQPDVELGKPLKRSSLTQAEQVSSESVDSIWVGPPRPTGELPSPEISQIDKDLLLTRITNEVQSDKSVLYKLDGEPAFIDRGMRLEMADGASQSDEKVLAALLTAAQYYRGRIELTGSEAFQRKAIGLIAQHQLNVVMKNPAQQLQLEEARKSLQSTPTLQNGISGDSPPIYEAAKPPVQPSAAPEASTVPSVPAGATEQLPHPDPAASPQAGANRQVDHVHVEQSPVAGATVPTEAAPREPEGGADEAKDRVEQEVHTSPQAAREGVTGKIMGMGNASFQFDPSNGLSTYIKLRTQSGTQTFWGKELAGLIRETRVQPGNMVTLQWLGKEPVVIKAPVKDAEGKTVGYEDKPAHRNNWSLELRGHPVVRTGDDVGVKMVAYDVQRFGAVQQEMLARMNLDVPLPTAPDDGLFWMTPDGQGSAKAGDHLTAPRPVQDPKVAGIPVMSSWSIDGHLDMALVRGDGDYLQGVVRHQGQLQHVLVSLPGREGSPAMVFNLISEVGMTPIGVGNGINRSGGEAVSRENIAFKFDGDTAVRIGKLDKPAEVPPSLHARLGFDERWRDDNSLPKSEPAVAPTAQPSVHRPA